MSDFQKFNLIHTIILRIFVLTGGTCIYFFPSGKNIIFWFSLILLWTYLYRPIVTRFFYKQMMEELVIKQKQLNEVSAEVEKKEKENI